MASKEVLNSAAWLLYFKIINNIETTSVNDICYVVPLEIPIDQAC